MMTKAQLIQGISKIKADRLRFIVDTVQDSSSPEHSRYSDLRSEEVELLTGMTAPETPWDQRLQDYYDWREKTEAIVIDGCPETIAEFVHAANNVYLNRFDDRFDEFKNKTYEEFLAYYKDQPEIWCRESKRQELFGVEIMPEKIKTLYKEDWIQMFNLEESQKQGLLKVKSLIETFEQKGLTPRQIVDEIGFDMDGKPGEINTGEFFCPYRSFVPWCRNELLRTEAKLNPAQQHFVDYALNHNVVTKADKWIGSSTNGKTRSVYVYK
jgi:hypothetical protein